MAKWASVARTFRSTLSAKPIGIAGRILRRAQDKRPSHNRSSTCCLIHRFRRKARQRDAQLIVVGGAVKIVKERAQPFTTDAFHGFSDLRKQRGIHPGFRCGKRIAPQVVFKIAHNRRPGTGHMFADIIQRPSMCKQFVRDEFGGARDGLWWDLHDRWRRAFGNRIGRYTLVTAPGGYALNK